MSNSQLQNGNLWRTARSNEITHPIRSAATLFRRAGFGATHSQIQTLSRHLKKHGTQGAYDKAREIWREGANPASQRTIQLLESATMAGGNDTNQQLSSWWLYRMTHTNDPILERMTLFWHGHFATSNSKVRSRKAMMAQYQLLNKHALGYFEPMVQGISRDPAMLVWLDATTNRKARPNENYARELLELFCLGEGNYTEKDIKEVARCFTGWGLKRGYNSAGSFHFNKYQHDTGEKSFLGNRGVYGGEEAVSLVLKQRAASVFLLNKLAGFYLSEEPRLSPQHLRPLADRYRVSRYHNENVLKVMIESKTLIDHGACRIKSPVEMAIGLLRGLNASCNMLDLAKGLERLGQSVFYPPTVKGWDGGRNWLDTSTIIGSANGIHHLLHSKKTKYAAGSLSATVKESGATTPTEWVDWACDLFIPVELPASCKKQLLVTAKSGGNKDESIRNILVALSIMPEFHLG